MKRQQEEAAERARLAAIEAAKPKPPSIELVYLGSFGPGQRKIAVFADKKGENIYNAAVGETIEGKFIVHQIGFESVDLAFVGFPDVPPHRLAVGG